MIIMGIDPGTARTGVAVIDISKVIKSKLLSSENRPELIDYTCVETPATELMHMRLMNLKNALDIIVQKYKPQQMVVERLFFNTNVKTAITVGQARAIPLLIAAQMNVEVFEYTALEAKLSLTGYGRSDKKEVQEAVRILMGLEAVIKPDDANDALAIALCHIHKDNAKHKKAN